MSDLAQTIYEARFAHEKPRYIKPWAELGENAKAVWRCCADAAAAAIGVRIGDLLEANNRYLQRARDAEAKAKTYEAHFKELQEPTHRHLKTGGLYRIIGEARIEADLSPVTVYVSAKSEMWVRPTAEFNDGRFERLPDDFLPDEAVQS